MTLQQFEEILLALDLTQFKTVYQHIRYSSEIKPYLDSYDKKISNQYVGNDALYAEWSTGGMSGGNCWDDAEPTHYSSDDKPKDLTDLDKILTAVRPNTSFLEYRALTSELIKHGTRSESEYYGNSSDYAYTYIFIKDLYNYLNGKGWLNPDLKIVKL